MREPGNDIVWLTFAASLAPILFAYLAVVRLRERQRACGEFPAPGRYTLTAGFFLGGLGGMLFGILVGPRVVVDEWTAAAITGPLAEELGKALLPIGLFIAGRLPDRAAGIAAGLMVGAGFAAVENLLYGLYAWADGGVDAWQSAVQLRLGYGTLIHLTSSGLVGVVLGRFGSDRRPWILLWAPVAALCVGWLVHGGWNGSLELIHESVAWAIVAQAIALSAFTAGAVLYVRELRTRAGDPTSASS